MALLIACPPSCWSVYRDPQEDNRAPQWGCYNTHGEKPYRRDRRKDLLLQENGFFVLRFLAEDVGKHLDDVLNAILRTLSHRQRGQL